MARPFNYSDIKIKGKPEKPPIPTLASASTVPCPVCFAEVNDAYLASHVNWHGTPEAATRGRRVRPNVV